MVVLDASALLAVIFNEPGADVVKAQLPAITSAVTFAEAAGKMLLRGHSADRVRQDLLQMVDVYPMTEEVAFFAADLISRFRKHDFSLGDCCCLATGIVLGQPILTAERKWTDYNTGARVQQIR